MGARRAPVVPVVLRPGSPRRKTSRYNTARRAFKLLDHIGQHEGVTAKALARELGVSLSTCYCLIDILVEEGFVEKIAHRKGYRLGAAVCALHARYEAAQMDARIASVVDELAARSGRHAYLGLLEDGEATLSRIGMPPKEAPVAVVAGRDAAAHALAIGKILIGAGGPAGIEIYLDDHGLKAFTTRTITESTQLGAHLAETARRGFATDLEEFCEDLCCVAAPISDEKGEVRGALGLSTTARHFYEESDALLDLVKDHARAASSLIG